MYALERKKEGADEEEEEEEEYDAVEYPQRVGRQKHVLDIEIQFSDSRRSVGSRGGRGGRGARGDRANGRGYGNRGPPRGNGPDAPGEVRTVSILLIFLDHSFNFWNTVVSYHLMRLFSP
jgi:plasminogen activator inhibitor 1 RNA-binding protein